MNQTNEQQLIDLLMLTLTLEWEDNGNIMAEAVRDSCLTKLSMILNLSIPELKANLNTLSDSMQ
jgi:hypothetical protein